jgi:hypothetical protein
MTTWQQTILLIILTAAAWLGLPYIAEASHIDPSNPTAGHGGPPPGWEQPYQPPSPLVPSVPPLPGGGVYHCLGTGCPCWPNNTALPGCRPNWPPYPLPTIAPIQPIQPWPTPLPCAVPPQPGYRYPTSPSNISLSQTQWRPCPPSPTIAPIQPIQPWPNPPYDPTNPPAVCLGTGCPCGPSNSQLPGCRPPLLYPPDAPQWFPSTGTWQCDPRLPAEVCYVDTLCKQGYTQYCPQLRNTQPQFSMWQRMQNFFATRFN